MSKQLELAVVSLGLVLSAAACGGTSDPVVILDGSPVDTLTPGPNRVTLRTFGSTQLVRFRDGAGPWLTPVEVTTNNWDLFVTDAYEVVIGCAASETSDVAVERRTYADGNTVYAFCTVPSDEPPIATVTVTGDMAQAGEVFLGGSASGTTAPWSFSIDTTAETHDLVAVGANQRLLVQRDLLITGATTLPTLDVTTAGVAMTATPLAITGMVSGEELTTSYDWFLGNDFVTLSGTSTTMMVPPASVVEASDFAFLNVSLESPTTYRYASTMFTGIETSFTPLPILSGITYAPSGGDLTASWGTLPTFDDVSLNLYANQRSVRVSTSKRWLDTTQAANLTTKIELDALDPAWRINLAGPYSRSFSATREINDVSYYTSVFESVNGSVARRAVTPSSKAAMRAALRDRR